MVRGWVNYFPTSSMKTEVRNIDAHLRTRLRPIIWKTSKVPLRRQWGLQKLGVEKNLARLKLYTGGCENLRSKNNLKRKTTPSRA